MQLEFLQRLDEGRALNLSSQLGRIETEHVVRLLFLELGALMIFQTEKPAQEYAKKTLDSGNFRAWKIFGTDVYNATVALTAPEYRDRLDIKHGNLNVPMLQKILRDASHGRAKGTDYSQFTMNVQRSFNLSSAILTSVRRRVSDYALLSDIDRKSLLGDMARFYSPFNSRGDMLDIASDQSDSATSRSLIQWAWKLGSLGLHPQK